MHGPPDDPLVWVNGEQGAGLCALDRGLAYGDGLFETMRYTHAGIPLLALHLRRLERGCARLRIGFDPAEAAHEIGAALAIARERIPEGVIKLVVTRGAGGRGYAVAPGLVPTRVLSVSPLPVHPPAWSTEGVDVRFCEMRLGANPQLAGIKHLNRLEQVVARLEWDDPSIAEGLLADARGRIVEGVATNLFVVSGGRLVTPAIETCGVAGVMRQYLIDEGCRALGIAVAEVPCERAMLTGAQEMFLCNSVVGIWPVRRLAGRVVTVGALTRRVQDHVARLFAG